MYDVSTCTVTHQPVHLSARLACGRLGGRAVRPEVSSTRTAAPAWSTKRITGVFGRAVRHLRRGRGHPSYHAWLRVAHQPAAGGRTPCRRRARAPAVRRGAPRTPGRGLRLRGKKELVLAAEHYYAAHVT